MKRKRTTIQEAHQLLLGVNTSVAFYLNGGGTISSLEELAASLVAVDDQIYKHHANSEKNDFALWVKDIIKDEILAKDLLRARNRTSAAKKVSNRVELLKGMTN